MRMYSRCFVTAACAAAVAWPGIAQAQREYANSHGGRPIRVEDAIGEASGEIDLHFPTVRVDRFDFGASRWRFSPGLSFALHSTSVEVSGSFVQLEKGVRPRGGLSGLDVSVYQQVTRGNDHAPAILAAADVFVPAGAVRGGRTSANARGMATFPFGAWRLHTNASVGHYRVDVLNPAAVCQPSAILIKLGYQCAGQPPVFPGGPCAIIADSGADQHCATTAFVVTDTTTPVPLTLPRNAVRWSAGIAVDRDVRALSTLLLADVYVSRLNGVQPRADWIAEIGARHLLGSRVVADAAIGRRFIGAQLGWSVTAGLTTSLRAARE